MILTITLSPTFDLTYNVDQIAVHEINVVKSKNLEPSGKGFNVSYNLVQEGHHSIAIVPLAETQLSNVWSYMARERIKVLSSKTSNEIRINTSVVDGKEVTKFNEKAAKLTDLELNDLIQVIDDAAKENSAKWIVLSGGVHVDNANQLGVKLRAICEKYGCKLAIDTSGPASEILFGFKPDFVKPNRDEIAQIYPSALNSDKDYQLAVIQLAEQINGTVLCTNGGSTAYAANNEVLLEIVPPVIAGVNSVGAGDASLAGYLAAESSGSDFVTAISMAMSWASAACQNPGTAGLNMPAAKGAVASIKTIGAITEINLQNNLLIGGSK
jgi:1-phosphofructokinase